MVAFFAFASLFAMFLSIYFNKTDAPTVTKMCAVTPFAYSYTSCQYTLITVASCASVAIYILVFITYRRTMVAISPNISNSEEEAIAQQRRLTVTLGIISVSTIIFFLIPSAFVTVYAWMHIPLTPTKSVILAAMIKCSTTINVAIYVYRQREVRREIWKIVGMQKSDNAVLRLGFRNSW